MKVGECSEVGKPQAGDEEAPPSAMGGGAQGWPLSRSPPPSVTSSEGLAAQRQPSPRVSTTHSCHFPGSTSLFTLFTSRFKLFFRSRGPPRGSTLQPPVCTAPATALKTAHAALCCPHSVRHCFAKLFRLFWNVPSLSYLTVFEMFLK